MQLPSPSEYQTTVFLLISKYVCPPLLEPSLKYNSMIHGKLWANFKQQHSRRFQYLSATRPSNPPTHIIPHIKIRQLIQLRFKLVNVSQAILEKKQTITRGNTLHMYDQFSTAWCLALFFNNSGTGMKSIPPCEGRGLITFIKYPASCGPKGHGSSGRLLKMTFSMAPDRQNRS